MASAASFDLFSGTFDSSLNGCCPRLRCCLAWQEINLAPSPDLRLPADVLARRLPQDWVPQNAEDASAARLVSRNDLAGVRWQRAGCTDALLQTVDHGTYPLLTHSLCCSWAVAG